MKKAVAIMEKVYKIYMMVVWPVALGYAEILFLGNNLVWMLWLSVPVIVKILIIGFASYSLGKTTSKIIDSLVDYIVKGYMYLRKRSAR